MSSGCEGVWVLREGVTGVWEPPGAAVCPSGHVSELVLLYTRHTVAVTNRPWNDTAPKAAEAVLLTLRIVFIQLHVYLQQLIRRHFFTPAPCPAVFPPLPPRGFAS